MNEYYIYIMSNTNNTVLYIGVTNDIIRRVYEHKNKILEGFSNDYNLNKLVYYEIYNDIKIALEREKHLKKWNREWKDNLINKVNINRNDLYENLIN
ncbi:GIY-YIG nuclease family protein [Candidatus Gracilibacteria bacterium]|nr:GIY-YIG nuclease family protein [Candidatus Gracilibacteria bacterium]